MASLFPDDRLVVIHQRLLAHYGPPPSRELWDPLTQCIYSMLSSRTKTEVSHQVLANLRETFGTWENLRDAPVAEIEDAIRAATFPETKAIHLKDTLQQITTRCGTLSLDFLANYRTEKIRNWLEGFPGVGVKTSAAVVNFSTLRRPAMCIDSHHLRIARRLGLVPDNADARETEDRLMEMAPADWTAEILDDDHSLFKLHGQHTCIKNDPQCARCPLLDLCPTGLKLTGQAQTHVLSSGEPPHSQFGRR